MVNKTLQIEQIGETVIENMQTDEQQLTQGFESHETVMMTRS